MEISDDDEYEMISESDHELDDYDEPKPTYPLLVHEIELLKTIFPESNVSTKILPGISQMDLEMSFPTTHLNEIVMAAWGLKAGSAITLHLTLHANLYLSSSGTIRADVFQESSATCNRNGTLQQIKNIAQAFIMRQCRSLTNEKVELAMAMCGENHLNVPVPGADAQQGQNIRDPPLDYGFLVQIYFYIQERLMNLNKFCPICDEKHPQVTSSNMLKPVVCNKPLCIFSFQTLGVTSYITSCMQSQPQVVQLLVLLTKTTVFSKRHALVLNPFPTLVHPEKPEKIILDPLKDFPLLRSVIKRIPKISEIKHLSEDGLKKALGSSHILCYPLLRWIISSNRSHIELISEEKQLKFMGTKHQFLLFNRPPEEDDIFKEQKKKLGSVFAFHGSPIDNWHAIIRQGLLVASGTAKQLNGAAFGAGIYLSPILNKSMQYTTLGGKIESLPKLPEPGEKNEDFIYDSTYLYCIALCEVINDGYLTKHSSQIWTCKKSENVCTRFFFVYDLNYPVLSYIDANISALPFCDQVKAALASVYP